MDQLRGFVALPSCGLPDRLLKKRTGDGAEQIRARAELCKPVVDGFIEWLEETLRDRILLPSNPFTQAAQYALVRDAKLRVSLEYPDIPLDTNHLERVLRVIATGRQNGMPCWTEIGAEHVGSFQSLLVTCRLHGIDPYTYLVDVLQRIDTHPAADRAADSAAVERALRQPPAPITHRPGTQPRRSLTGYVRSAHDNCPS